MAKYKRKAKVPKKPKLYCPYTFIRYDNSPNFEYKPVWVCKMCLKFLLSAESTSNHFVICNVRTYHEAHAQPTPPPSPTRVIKFDINGYVCEHCNMLFSRQVVLKKHVERHRNTKNSEDSDYCSD